MWMTFLGWAMLTTSLLTKFVGLPGQIWANFKASTAPRALRSFIFWGGLAYALQTIRCAILGDWMTALAQGPGAVFMAILLYQMHRYPASPD